MGHSSALGMTESGLPLRDQLAWHLTSNHYPPIPTTMIDTCIKAIEFGRDEDWHAEIELPSGVFYKGSPSAPTWAIVEQHHLDAWISE